LNAENGGIHYYSVVPDVYSTLLFLASKRWCGKCSCSNVNVFVALWIICFHSKYVYYMINWHCFADILLKDTCQNKKWKPLQEDQKVSCLRRISTNLKSSNEEALAHTHRRWFTNHNWHRRRSSSWLCHCQLHWSSCISYSVKMVWVLLHCVISKSFQFWGDADLSWIMHLIFYVVYVRVQYCTFVLDERLACKLITHCKEVSYFRLKYSIVSVLDYT